MWTNCQKNKNIQEMIKRKIVAKNGHTKYHKFFNSDVVAQFIINRTFGLNSKIIEKI